MGIFSLWAVEELRIPAYGLGLVVAGVGVMMVVMVVVWIRNWMLERRYQLISGSVKVARDDEVEMRFINSSTNVIEPEDLDRIYKRH